MQRFLIIVLATLTFAAHGQDKNNYVHFNKLVEVKATDYVIASIESRGKMYDESSQYILFINTKTGLTKQIDFVKDASIETIEQIKIDSLGVNKIIVSGRTIDLNEKKGIDWEDPNQIIIISSDGREKVQLTESKFFVRTWATNSKTGTIVVNGYYDSNNNNKYDKTDKNEILIYDLRTLKLINKI